MRGTTSRSGSNRLSPSSSARRRSLVLVAALAASLQLFAEGRASRYYSMDGYGMVIRRTGSRIELLDVTSISSFRAYVGRLGRDGQARVAPPGLAGWAARAIGQGMLVSVDEESFSFQGKSYRLVPLPEPPVARIADASKNGPDSLEVLIANIEERSVAFDHVGREAWDRAKARAREAAGDAGEEELFALMAELIATLRDGHTTLSTGTETAESTPRSAFTRDMIAGGTAAYKATIMARLEAPKKGECRRLLWGRLGGSEYGYLAVAGLMNMRGKSEDYEAQAAAVERDLALAAADLAGAPGLILDLRINGGGYDGLAKLVAGLFLSERVLAYSTQARIGAPGEFGPPEPQFVDPLPRALGGKPLVVLTSPLTASAAEVLILILKNRPGLTLVGETTAGCFSDALEKRLPNGWIATLSNERYLSPEGIDYEQRGFDPDIPTPILYEDFASGRDPALERGIEALDEALRRGR